MEYAKCDRCGIMTKAPGWSPDRPLVYDEWSEQFVCFGCADELAYSRLREDGDTSRCTLFLYEEEFGHVIKVGFGTISLPVLNYDFRLNGKSVVEFMTYDGARWNGTVGVQLGIVTVQQEVPENSI